MAILSALLCLGHTPALDPGVGGGGAGVDAFERLGETRVINAGDSAEKLNELFSVHRAALLQDHGDLVRLREKVDRMVPEAQALLRQAKSEARAEFVPQGNARQMDARYLRPDGAVIFGRTVETVDMPGGDPEQVVRHGFLSDPHPVTEEQLRARNAHSGFTIAFHRAKKMNADPWRDPLVRKSFVNFRKAMLAVPGQTGEFLRSMFSSSAELKRVISNATGTGAELVLVPTMSNLRRPADLARRIPGLFAIREVASPSFKQPIVTGRALATKRGATGNDPTRYPVSTFTSSDVTLTVVDQVIMALIDPLWVSDASQILDDPMGLVLAWLESGYLDTLELAMLHADTAGTHQDAIATWTMGGLYTAGQLDGVNASSKWWAGIRARAYDDGNNISAGGSFDIADHFTAIEAMGNHGADAVAITGLHCLYTQILPYSGFTTVDKMGQLATQITGEIGKLGKNPLIISEMIPNDFANTGLYTGSGSTTEIVYVDPTSYEYYEYAGGADDFDQMYPDKGAQYVGMVRRGLFAPTCLATEKPAAVSYNL